MHNRGLNHPSDQIRPPNDHLNGRRERAARPRACRSANDQSANSTLRRPVDPHQVDPPDPFDSEDGQRLVSGTLSFPNRTIYTNSVSHIKVSGDILSTLNSFSNASRKSPCDKIPFKSMGCLGFIVVEARLTKGLEMSSWVHFQLPNLEDRLTKELQVPRLVFVCFRSLHSHSIS